MKNGLKIFLIITAIVLSYLIYNSVDSLVKFREDRTSRYVDVIGQLKDVANAERLYLGARGAYTDNLDSLKDYLQNGKIYTISRKDSSAYVYDSQRRIDVMKNFTIFDTIELKTSVMDSVFGKRKNAFKDFGYVMITEDGNTERIPIKMYANYNDRIIGEDSTNIQRDFFFKGSVTKKDALRGLDSDMVAREIVDEQSPIKGEELSVGSDSRPSLEGNWGTDLDVLLREKRAGESIQPEEELLDRK